MDIEKIKSNWNTYENLCSRLNDDNINIMSKELGDRLVICPAAPRDDNPGCFPGGLIQTSLDTTIALRKINESMDLNLETHSIIKVGLFHEIGKVGSKTTDCFINQEADWHREKLGEYYKYNPELSRMSVSHRTLCLLQEFGVSLSPEEWISIQTAQGSHFEENRFYVGHEPTLAIALQQAKIISNHKSSSDRKS